MLFIFFSSGPLSAGGIIKNVSSLSGNLLNDLCHHENKNLSVKPLSSTWITSVFITICSLEIVHFVANLAMITTLKCSGLSHAFRCVVEKNKNVIHQPMSVRIGKNFALCLEYRPRPAASGDIQDLGHSFSLYGPPGWWITYIYGWWHSPISGKEKAKTKVIFVNLVLVNTTFPQNFVVDERSTTTFPPTLKSRRSQDQRSRACSAWQR